MSTASPVRRWPGDTEQRPNTVGCHSGGTHTLPRHGRDPLMARSITLAMPPSPTPRFLQLADVAEVLNISAAQAYALVRTGALRAVKIGGRGQWRVEASELEAYIRRLYDETEAFVAEHPFGATEETEGDLR